MSIPKSSKLRREEQIKPNSDALPSFVRDAEPAPAGIIKIREVPCCNDYVAVRLFTQESSIALPEGQKHKNEGIVIGVGPGVPTTDGGGRVPSQLKVGDVVMFLMKNVITEVESEKPPYKGFRVVILSERSILLKLPSVEYENVS
jgi:co-chaperonin GroES (HSP10)